MRSRLAAMIRKEFSQLLRDVPILLILVWAFTGAVYTGGHGISTEIRNYPIVVLDLARSPASRELVSRFRAPYFTIVAYARSDAELVAMLDRGRASLAQAKQKMETARTEAAGLAQQAVGDLEASVDAYRASIAVRPTAEAHTFLGWVYSFQDRYDEAIAECERAIAVDPSFGNPYNDIGAYLIELDRLDESIPWFEKAKAAKRYCCYFYAYSNLARVYMMKGMTAKAKRELEEALRINPEYEFARDLLRRIERGRDYIE